MIFFLKRSDVQKTSRIVVKICIAYFGNFVALSDMIEYLL